MAEKVFFGASKSEINRFKSEVYRDYNLGKPTLMKGKKGKKRKR